MKRDCVMGIDPGLTGGLAIISPEEGLLMEPMPRNEEFIEMLMVSEFLFEHGPRLKMVFIEQANAMPKQGVSSMFKFGRVFGALEGIIATHKLPCTYVRPQQWTKKMHEGLSKDIDTKERSRIIFSRLFPGIDSTASEKSSKPHMGMVEAALIAEYGRRVL